MYIIYNINYSECKNCAFCQKITIHKDTDDILEIKCYKGITMKEIPCPEFIQLDFEKEIFLHNAEISILEGEL